VAEKIETIIYTDFINSVGPIVSELSELGIESVAYYGEMDTKSRNESYSNWKTGKVSVMVATSAFGMGIDKPDIHHIIRLGVPENICSWAQELGRAGRNGQSAVATIFYSMSDIDHGGAWVREHVNNPSYCKQILKEFSNSWRYTMSDLVGKCRRQVLLDLFGEDAASLASTCEYCCDVCSQSKEFSLTDCMKELEVLIVLGDKGEVKLAQWIRGSSQEWTIQYNKDCHSFSNSMGHSEAWWRTFMRQCHVEGVVEKQLRSIIKKSGHYCIQGLFHVLPKGRDIVQQRTPFLLPSSTAMVTQHSNAAASDTSSNDKKTTDQKSCKQKR